jgi:gamma-glutamylcyclotransferase (GGCT)/AIG2-like uncharacterized protein YtfP
MDNTKLTFNGRNLGVANIVYSKGNMVPGGIWEINSKHLKALDRYEGFPSLYIRKDVLVVLPGGEKVQVMTYVMVNTDRSLCLCKPSNNYFNIIMEGYHDFGLDRNVLIDYLSETLENIRKEEYFNEFKSRNVNAGGV